EFAPMRLQKFLARAGVDSRRHCEQIILDGRVSVNGHVVDELGTKIDPRIDEVSVDGQVVSLGDSPVTIMMNKPAGYLTTMDDPQGRACVAQLEPFGRYPGLFPVGRLDKDTTGLLVITSDGALGYKLAHPKHHVVKTYVAHVHGKVSKQAIRKLCEGVMIRDGMTAPAQVRVLRDEATGSVLELKIHEGRNRQVRRMCQAVGHPVIQLERVAMGPLQLGNLPVGSWRMLSPQEIFDLRRAALGE
ncbi:MAG: rRNA pseudouridine synthase, partial [Eggerthellaceae bacterium]|nr:rRNA pseudouridine synthase [Eggerthellaceae bacterium]